MPTFKIVILTNKQNQRQDGLYNVKIRLGHNKGVVYFKTNYNIRKSQIKKGEIIKHKSADHMNYLLQNDINNYRRILLSHNINNLSVNDVVRLLYYSDGEGVDFYKYAETRIKQLQSQGKKKTAESYQYAVNHLKKFAKNLNFADINYSFLTRFENTLRKTTGSTTISIYLRAIRAIYNRAINEDLIPLNLYPFRKFKVVKGTSRKRNLTIEQLQALRDAELTDKDEIFARDMFMLMFYLIGINFKDLFYLPGIENGRIYYSRAKTGKRYSVMIQPEAKEIIERYKGENRLLIVTEKIKHHESLLKKINEKLRDIGKAKKLPFDLTTYYCRHTWSTLAVNMGIGKDIVSLALGHSYGNSTTENYIEYDMRLVDVANRQLLNNIKSNS